MKFVFSKYHGTGNDFILIDNRDATIHLSQEEIKRLCDRHFGIGADGLMFLTAGTGHDFGMKYFNSDGKESTMCGNGGRCMTAFARALGIIEQNADFTAIDGEHEAMILDQTGPKTMVKLKMSDVPSTKYLTSKITNTESSLFLRPSSFVLNTGSPHLVLFTENVSAVDVVAEGRKHRNNPEFAPDGINVDFVEKREQRLFVRTYERGVEDETLSCGTGVTAAALAYASWQIAVGSKQEASGSMPLADNRDVIARNEVTKQTRTGTKIEIETPGGQLTVSFRRGKSNFTDIWLEGPAEFVFKGETEVRET